MRNMRLSREDDEWTEGLWTKNSDYVIMYVVTSGNVHTLSVRREVEQNTTVPIVTSNNVKRTSTRRDVV